MKEFENQEVKISTDSEDLYVEFLAFVNRFPDLDPEMDVFDMLKLSVKKQNQIRGTFTKLLDTVKD